MPDRNLHSSEPTALSVASNSQDRGTSVAEGSPYRVDRNGLIFTSFHGGSFYVDFLENEIVVFHENLEVDS